MNRIELRLKLVEELADRLNSDANKDATDEQKLMFLEEMVCAAMMGVEALSPKRALFLNSTVMQYLLNNPTLVVGSVLDDPPEFKPLDEPEVAAAKKRPDKSLN
jgi:hypothetical protein